MNRARLHPASLPFTVAEDTFCSFYSQCASHPDIKGGLSAPFLNQPIKRALLLLLLRDHKKSNNHQIDKQLIELDKEYFKSFVPKERSSKKKKKIYRMIILRKTKHVVCIYFSEGK